MKTFVMPDPLTWQSGVEFGLLALGATRRSEPDLFCHLHARGPLLECVGFTVHRLGLEEHVSYTTEVVERISVVDMVLLPRVQHMNERIVSDALDRGAVVITSDPGIQLRHERLATFVRRDWHTMAELMTTVPWR